MRIRSRTLALVALILTLALTLALGVGLRVLGADQRAAAQAVLDQDAGAAVVEMQQEAAELARAASAVSEDPALHAFLSGGGAPPDAFLQRAGWALDVDALLLVDGTGPRWGRLAPNSSTPLDLPAGLIEQLRHASASASTLIARHEGEPWLVVTVPVVGWDARLVLARMLDAGRLAQIERISRARVELRPSEDSVVPLPGEVAAAAPLFGELEGARGWSLVLQRAPYDAERVADLLAVLGGNLSVLAVVVGVLLLLVIDRMVLRRLAHLADLASRLTDGADHGVRLPTGGENDEIDRLAAAMNGILDQVDANTARLRHDALHDPLTGLANRALFTDRLEVALARARRADIPGVAVLFIDLDRLKAINDQLGHDAGDHYISEAARRLQVSVRPGDTVARLGGDEFAIVFTDILDTGAAHRRGQSVLELLRTPLRYHSHEHPVSASIGLALASRGHTAEQLLREADIAMYSAKAGGRDRLAVFDEHLQGQLTARSSLETLLRRALANSEVEVNFQPIVRTDDLAVVGVEALARWHHDGVGEVEPSRFLPVALDSSLAVHLDRYVLFRAVSAARRVRDIHSDAFVAVNFSARTLDEPDSVLFIQQALQSASLPGSALVVELREATLGRNEARWLPQMQELTAMGVRFALDDFGLGQTPIARLVGLPVQVLKIEGDLVRGLGHGGGSVALGLIGLAAALGRTVVAKGVEEEVQRERLRAVGCPLMQGYLVGRPQPLDLLMALIGHAAPLADS